MTERHRQPIGLNLLHLAYGAATSAPAVADLDWARITSLDFNVGIATRAERGGIDNILLADSPSFAEARVDRVGSVFEPLTFLSAIAARTERIGVIPTLSTTFNEPYNVARYIASLELIAPGRAGWNVVTSSNPLAARNFGLDEQPAHGERYRRAAEFVDVVTKLWVSWFVRDDIRAGARALDLDRDIHPIHHHGEFFSVEGALNVPPAHARTRPLISQAGASAAGRELGGRIADVIYTNQQSIGQAKEFLADIHRHARAYRRNPEDIAVLPGVVTILGSTVREARDREARQREEIDLEQFYLHAEKYFRIDLSGYDPDAPFPVDALPEVSSVRGSQGTFLQITRQIAEDDLTVEQAIRRYIVGQIHRTFVGTPEQFADDIEAWVSAGAAHGFTLQPDLYPDGLDIIVDQVIPLLEAKGLRKRFD